VLLRECAHYLRKTSEAKLWRFAKRDERQAIRRRDSFPAEVARLRAAGVQFRNDIVSGPGGSQILLKDPSGNFIELLQPARR
jgi:hypothetical protein